MTWSGSTPSLEKESRLSAEFQIVWDMKVWPVFTVYPVFDFFLCLESEFTVFVWILWHIFFIQATRPGCKSVRVKPDHPSRQGREEADAIGKGGVSGRPIQDLGFELWTNLAKTAVSCCDMEKSLVLWKIPSEHTRPVECGDGDLQIKMCFSFWLQTTKLMTHASQPTPSTYPFQR